MQAVYWDERIKTDVKAYVRAVLGDNYELLLPSAKTIDGVGYVNDLNENGPINGMALQRVQVRLRCAGADTDNAAEDRACMKVGNRIHILIYENDQIGNRTSMSPIQCPFPDFHKAVLRDLRMIATTHVGRALLTSLDQNGGNAKVVIRFRDGFSLDNESKVDFRVSQPGSLTTLRVRGQASTFTPGAAVGEALVGYNPMFFGVAKVKPLTHKDDCVKKGKWGAPEQKSPDVTLFHELIHADDAIRGIFEPEDPKISRNGTNVKLSEMRAVGLDAFGQEALLDLNAAAKIYCENTYRAERGFVLRDYYSNPNETRGATVVTDRMQDFLSYLDPSFMVLGQFVDPALMTMAEFRAQTKHKGERNKILDVENALQTYNRTKAHDPSPIERVRGLIAVMAACHAYKRKPKAKRDVSGLLTAAGDKVRAITTAMLQAVPAPPTPAYYKTLRELSGVLTQWSHDLTGPGPAPPVGNTDGEDGRRALNAAYDQLYRSGGGKLAEMQRPTTGNPDPNVVLTAQSVTTLQGDDLQQLTAMSGQTPAVTTSVITEMVGVARQQNVALVDTRAGSSAGPTPQGYNVTWGQWSQDDIRLGTLIHELTHVSTHQSFNNTPCMFSFASGLAANAVRDIEQERTQKLQALVALASGGDFTAYQRYWLIGEHGTHKGKLVYALANGNGVVENALWPPPPLIDPDEGTYGPRAPAHAEWTRLWSTYGQIKQVFWEFDTVINQCLIYMHMWQVPLNDPLYTRLRTVGQELYDARAQARAPVQVIQPVNNPPPNNAPPPRQDLGFFRARRGRATTV